MTIQGRFCAGLVVAIMFAASCSDGSDTVDRGAAPRAGASAKWCNVAEEGLRTRFGFAFGAADEAAVRANAAELATVAPPAELRDLYDRWVDPDNGLSSSDGNKITVGILSRCGDFVPVAAWCESFDRYQTDFGTLASGDTSGSERMIDELFDNFMKLPDDPIVEDYLIVQDPPPALPGGEDVAAFEAEQERYGNARTSFEAFHEDNCANA